MDLATRKSLVTLARAILVEGWGKEKPDCSEVNFRGEKSAMVNTDFYKDWLKERKAIGQELNGDVF